MNKPTIVFVNEAKTPLGVDLHALVKVLQKYVDNFIVPWYGPSSAATLIVAPKLLPGQWGMILLDNADQQGALGYHDVTPDGLPLGKVFVKTAVDNGELPCVTASHELVEMLVDPWTSMLVQDPTSGTIYAYEPADPTESDKFEIDNIHVSNFVTPAWFQGFRAAGSEKFDAMGLIHQPFQLRHDGYMPVMDPKTGNWTQIFGSEIKAAAFAKEDRRGHRTEMRKPIQKLI